MKKEEKLEIKGAGPLRSGQKGNLRAFPVIGKQVECPKCGTLTVEEKCPTCEIPLAGFVRGRKVVSLEEFRRRGKAKIHKLPVVQRRIRICPNPDCKNATTEDICPLCGTDLYML